MDAKAHFDAYVLFFTHVVTLTGEDIVNSGADSRLNIIYPKLQSELLAINNREGDIQV